MSKKEFRTLRVKYCSHEMEEACLNKHTSKN